MLTIKRTYEKLYTKGVMLMPDGTELYTLELPWLNNKPYVSCIPEGEYFFMRDTTGRHTYFRLISVDGRTNIEFHPARHVDQLEGCIAPCLQLINGNAVASRTACDKMLKFYNQLHVKYLLRIYS